MKNKAVKRACIIIALVFMVPIFLFFTFKFVKGYYPFPMWVKVLYYAAQYDITKPNDDIIDETFHFFEEGYTVTKKISSPYPIEHSLVIRFTNKLPVDQKLSMAIKLEVMEKGKVIYSKNIRSGSNGYRYENGKPSYTCSYGLCDIPFPLAGKPLKGLDIKITVLEADKKLLDYVNTGQLVLWPNISLEG